MKIAPLTVFALLALGAIRVNAQSTAPRWSLDLTAGPAFPAGSFHKSTAYGGSALVTKPGGSAELSASYRFWRSFSAVFVVQGQENKGGGIPYTYLPAGSDDNPIGSSNWKIARAMAGATYTLALTKKTGPELLLRLLGGVQKTSAPDYKVADLQSTTELYLTCMNCAVPTLVAPGQSFPWSFGYEAAAGLKWRFNNRFAVLGWAGYQGSRPSKDLHYSYIWNSQTNSYSPGSQKTTISTATFSLRAGVSYNLSN